MDVRHRHVAGCVDQFKQNGTVYRVGEYISGASLAAYIRQHQGKITEEGAVGLMNRVLSALEACHARRLCHGGITPKSIFMTMDGQPTLIAFHAARLKLARKSDALKEALLAGFSAPEIATGESPEGPAWDIYGCAATLLYMLSGRVPPTIASVAEAGRIQTALHRASGLTPELRNVLEQALAYHPADRPATAGALAERLTEAVEHASNHRLRAGSLRQNLHVSVELEGSSSDEIWHREVELVATTPSALSPNGAREAEMPVYRTEGEAERSLPREEAKFIPAPAPTQLTTAPAPDRPSVRLEEVAPAGREKELEQLVVKMVKWQQMFVGGLLGVIVLALLGVLAALFFAPGLTQRAGSAAPSPALAKAEAAPVPAPAAMAPLVLLDSIGVDSLSSRVPTDQAPLPEALPVDRPVIEAPPSVARALPTAAPERAAPRIDLPEARAEAAPARVDAPPSVVAEAESPVETLPVSEPPADTVAVAPAGPTPEEIAQRVRDEQFAYYRAQGDSLIRLGFDAAAMHLYRSALRLRPGDTYVSEQLSTIEQRIARDEREKQIADSLKVRLTRVTDREGYFLAPDTPVLILNETEVRKTIRYPFAAYNAGITGRVTIQYLVDAEGRFVTAKVLNAIGGGCENEVINALKTARFQPGTFYGQPVTAWGRFSVVFGSRG
jgi:TonB family protein